VSTLDSSSQSLHHGSDTRGPSLSIVIDEVRTSAPDHFGCLSGFQWDFLRTKLLRAGLSPESIPIRLCGEEGNAYRSDVILAVGEKALRELTGRSSVDKWHLSPIPTEYGLVIPTFDFVRLNKQYECGLYFEMAVLRCAEFLRSPYVPVEEKFYLNPGLEETYAILKEIETKEEIAIDVETGYGQINTVGFAWSEREAIAINVLPARCSSHTYYELWSRINRVLTSGSRKIFQNFIYDTSYFSAYGVEVKGEIYDTMHAMKVLWPELDSNLGNVGRIYTRRPYWKDDGKVESEEGKKKDWGNVRDWHKHYTYNCRDTTGTLAASIAQRSDLSSRKLGLFYSDYLARLIPIAREMCAVGMPLDLDMRERLKEETEAKIETFVETFQDKAGEINPRSPKQIQTWLTGLGVKLPKKYDKESGSYRDTTDANAIKRIRLKKDIAGLKELQEIKSLDKALSSYIDFDVRPDGRLSYGLNITGTETLRWSGGKDAWDRGFNIQTIPREGGDISIKSMFNSPHNLSFLEVDLRQAESRFVAYVSADKTLIDMLESGADVHSHVGNAILRQMGKDPTSIPKEEFKSTWRQLGKKAGHGLNYGMKPRVFVETVFNELDMVISVKDAENITAAYFSLFPGIPQWHAWLRRELYQKRKLTAPSGWERYFYGRPGDDMFKEGAAWAPQHTIPWITNHLAIYLAERRAAGEIDFNFIYQCHDSLVLMAPNSCVDAIAKVCLDTKAGHPEIILPGGKMYIPREVKVGQRMSEMQEWS